MALDTAAFLLIVTFHDQNFKKEIILKLKIKNVFIEWKNIWNEG
jgi:hypothetical protein